MAHTALDNVIEQADALSADEQLQLIAHLVERVRVSYPVTPDILPTQTPPRRSWREIEGALPYPALGEDVQAWVSRTRREGTQPRSTMEQHGLGQERVDRVDVQDDDEEKLTITERLARANYTGGALFKTAEEVDAYICEERDSWER